MTAVDIQISAIVHDGILVFEPKPIEFPKDSDIQSDSFKKSKGKITGMIENVFKQWLKFHPDDSAFTNPGTENQPFTLLKYRTVHTIDGLSVALTVEYENETYCLCCTDDMKLDFKVIKENVRSVLKTTTVTSSFFSNDSVQVTAASSSSHPYIQTII
ncbi:uncharacterized protein [Engystomops pustulosus]|uniref:uncharacterized protein isoform X2 n=1 Tax=Engystomops pustulosus TaxID=76066 RepID=UPI003AFA41DE